MAAFAVVLYHVRSWTSPYTFGGGFLAVDLFFVLSGFVIASSYEPRLASGAMGSWRFMWVRFVRLYPLYLLGVALGLATPLMSLLLKGQILPVYAEAWRAAPFAVAMLPNPPGGALSPLFQLNSPCWSLFFELVVNVVYAFTWRLWSSGRLVVLVVALGAVTLWLGGGDQGWRWADFSYGLLRVFYSFPVGVLIYRLHARGFRLPQTPSWAILLAMAAMLTVPSPPFARLSVVFGFPLLVAFGVSANPARWWQAALAEAGAVSYAVYVLHLPLFDAVREWAQKLGMDANVLLLGLGFAAAMIPLGMAADRLYDGPVRARLIKLRAPLRARPLQPVSPDPSP